MRKDSFANGEFHHIYNRGVDKRNIFLGPGDLDRFLESIKFFNSTEPIGSIRDIKELLANSQTSDIWEKRKRLVDIVCYCLNPNHYHLLLLQHVNNGISEFIKRLGGGYTKFFNEKHDRSGVLFQGKFKSIRISSNEYLLHLSSYINLNNQIKGNPSRLSKSSWDEFVNPKDVIENFCHNKEIILGQFNDGSKYKTFALDALEDILERKNRDKNFGNLFLE
ncbi:MAG: transposase [Parcubacteria group bacterium]|nr:transposase [Parcubacteria group bacterium]